MLVAAKPPTVPRDASLCAAAIPEPNLTHSIGGCATWQLARSRARVIGERGKTLDFDALAQHRKVTAAARDSKCARRQLDSGLPC